MSDFFEYFSMEYSFDAETILQLLEISLIPICMSVLVYLIRTYTPFKKMKFWPAQAIIGVLFGICSIVGTELGVPIDGAVINVRDAAPLCAGLCFGAPAAILSGLMGGIHRLIWATGDYTRIACSVSTIIAGLYAGLLRKHLFDNKRPNWGVGFATGAVMEVIHLSLVFLTHLDDSARAFGVVVACTIPMIFVNSLAVAVSILIISIVNRGLKFREKKIKGISQIIQAGLLTLVVVAYLFTTIFVYALQTSTAVSNAETILKQNILDIENEITQKVDKDLIDICYNIKLYIESGISTVEEMATKYKVAEINRVDKDGFIIESTNPDFVGFDMKSGEQSAEFMCLTENVKEFTQAYGPISYDTSIYRKYVGMAIASGGFIQVGFDGSQFQKAVDDLVADLTKNRHINTDGYLIISSENGKIVSNLQQGRSSKLENSGLDANGGVEPYNLFIETVYDVKSLCMYGEAEGYYIIALIPMDTVFEDRTSSVYVNSFMEVIVFGALFILVYLLIKAQVVDKIKVVNKDLGRIIDGNLDTVVNVKSTDEFASLSNDINSTVDTLKHYIDEAAARIDKELAFAKSIQHSALPSVFPDEERYSLHATMDTAKEVGGDFYDFYKLDSDTLAILIADVSGKGIPAAMFMMQSKTMIKNLAEAGMPIADVMTTANERLCETNEAGMFVTTWLAFVNLKTGHVQFVNAGHNPPVLYRASEGKYDYMHAKVGLVLAGMDGIRYKMQEFDLEPGDKLYLYTDGITEATDAHNELYGEDRLITYLNANTELDPKGTLLGVKADVDKFVAEAEQFDDMTMLMVHYKGSNEKA